MHITVIGTGFVGVVSAAVFASFGHQVVGLDIDEAKVSQLMSGKAPFYEPNLDTLLSEQLASQKLNFTTDYAAAIRKAEVIFVAVGTPSAPDGQADLKFVLAAVDTLAQHIKNKVIIVIKSTVPPGTLEIVDQHLQALTSSEYTLASVPEFLREGSAVADTLNPDRVVIGARDPFTIETLKELHKPLRAPIAVISPESAQMAKYTAPKWPSIQRMLTWPLG
jgi:UDPglucose 6-dehydrogenase